MNDINQVILVLSILSFCMSFSGSFITFIKIINPLNINQKDFVIMRNIAEFFGYFSRILVGFLSDKYKQRKPFLLIGYVPVVILKLMMIITFTSFLSTPVKMILFMLTDIIDLSLNSARDISRDSYIADICLFNPSLLTRSLNIRKSISLLGTSIGLVFFALYYYIIPHYNSFIVLSIIAACIATIGVFVLVSNIQEQPQSVKQSNININILQIFSDKMWIGFIALFLINMTKPQHMSLFQKSCDIINHNYPKLSKYSVLINSCLLPIFYYLCGSIGSFILSQYNFNTINLIFIILAFVINFIHYFYISNIHNVFLIAGTIILYGLYNNISENILNTIILKKSTEKNITSRGTVLAISNIIMGLSSLFLAFILTYFKVSVLKIIHYGVFFNIAGFMIMGIYTYYI